MTPRLSTKYVFVFGLVCDMPSCGVKIAVTVHLSCPTVRPVHLSCPTCPTCPPVRPVRPVLSDLSDLSCPTCPTCPTCPVRPVRLLSVHFDPLRRGQNCSESRCCLTTPLTESIERLPREFGPAVRQVPCHPLHQNKNCSDLIQ